MSIGPPEPLIRPEDVAFLDSVLDLDPHLAAFDCDGTLWGADAGEGFFRWEIREGLLPRGVADWALSRYADYQAGKVDEDTMCGEMVTIHRGLRESDVQSAADDYFTAHMIDTLFPVMQELVVRLQKKGCEVWAVSSSNQWIIRAGMRYFGIPTDRILAAEVTIQDGLATDRLIRVPSGPGKATAIREVVKRVPDAAFGNSRWDADMLTLARSGFAINPNPDLEQQARTMGWPVYFPKVYGPSQ